MWRDCAVGNSVAFATTQALPDVLLANVLVAGEQAAAHEGRGVDENAGVSGVGEARQIGEGAGGDER